MKVQSIRLQLYRSFVDSGFVQLGNINVLIGKNNSGKSSVLRGLYLLQGYTPDYARDVRVGGSQSTLTVSLTEADSRARVGVEANGTVVRIQMTLTSSNRSDGSLQFTTSVQGGGAINGNNQPMISVDNSYFIVPYFSKRKAAQYSDDVSLGNANRVGIDVTYLAAKLARLGNPDFPLHEEYREACKALLGFGVTATPSAGGQHPSVYLSDRSVIPIEQMGEGVPNIVHFLVNLVESDGSLFLIEELENDLHPSALKALLNLIIKKSDKNQFVISTHSNIVVSHLGSLPDTRIFRVSSSSSSLPIDAKIQRIPDTADARISVLQELGYTFSDFSMWDGWLICEESSAERIIRDYLIPWFVPILSRVRTLAAGGVSKVEPSFDDFHRLMLYTHLQPAYAGRSWVRVDGDTKGVSLIQKLRGKYPVIEADRFGTFPQPEFERFYPREFASDIDRVLAIDDKQAKREAKKTLLEEVRKWLDANTERGKLALAESAKPVIDDLRIIESQLLEKNGSGS